MMTTILDTTVSGFANTKRYNEIFDSMIEDYTDFIDKLSIDKEDDLFWWTTGFAGRNVFLSDVIDSIVRLIYIIECIDNDSAIEEVYVSNQNIKDSLKKYYEKKYRTIKITTKEKNHIKIFDLYHCFKCVISFISNELLVKKTIARQRRKDNKKFFFTYTNKPQLCIRTYLAPSDITSDKKYVSRYFPNISDYLDNNHIFLPIIFSQDRSIIKDTVINCLELEDTFFLFREEYLSIRDYLKLFNILKSYKKYTKEMISFRGIDITKIVKADLMKNACLTNTYFGIVDYYLFSHLQQCGRKINRLVDWYEAQPSSFGAIMGFRKFYNNPCVGYLSIPFSTRHLQLFPTKEQYKQKVLPTEISVIGDYFAKRITRFCKDCNIIIGPPLRLQWINENNNTDINKNKNLKILVVLSALVDRSGSLLKAINELNVSMGIVFLIKNHPINEGYALDDYGIKDFTHEYEIVTGSFEKTITMADVILMSESSTSFEAVLSKKRVFCWCDDSKVINQLYMPLEWENKYYFMIYNLKELSDAIRHIDMKDDYVYTLNTRDYIIKANVERVDEILGYNKTLS